MLDLSTNVHVCYVDKLERPMILGLFGFSTYILVKISTTERSDQINASLLVRFEIMIMLNNNIVRDICKLSPLTESQSKGSNNCCKRRLSASPEKNIIPNVNTGREK